MYKRQSVDNVTLNYGTPQEQPISHMTIDQARDYISQGQFEFASMLPKVSASIDFLESGKGRKAIITTLDKAKDSLKGHGGTAVSYTHLDVYKRQQLVCRRQEGHPEGAQLKGRKSDVWKLNVWKTNVRKLKPLYVSHSAN